VIGEKSFPAVSTFFLTRRFVLVLVLECGYAE
jgi:hypothetical protein